MMAFFVCLLFVSAISLGFGMGALIVLGETRAGWTMICSGVACWVAAICIPL